MFFFLKLWFCLDEKMVENFKDLRALEGHKQVPQAQNLQHDFHYCMYFTIFFCFLIKVSIFTQLWLFSSF